MAAPQPSGSERPPIALTGTPGEYRRLCGGGEPPASWLRPGVLLRSRNDIVAKLQDPVEVLREQWLEIQGIPAGRERADALRVRGHEDRERISFMVLGDTGEGDASQMAVVPGVLQAARGTDFTVICSDVIYPAGESDGYVSRFYCPYRGVPGPIYGVPGNHDWYDRLVGFMTHFCNAERSPTGAGWHGTRGRLASILWRGGSDPDAESVSAARRHRPAARYEAQRGPYWSADAGPVRLVAIDTGIDGRVDRRQGDWLLQVSRERQGMPKILLTGKPQIVEGRYSPSPITGHSHRDRELTVDDVVRDPRHDYVAVIGGDIHNYQRYPVRLEDGRRIDYVVCGGSGAFMHGTHKIRRIDDEREGVAAQMLARAGARVTLSEAETHLFPPRSWSLFWFAQRTGGRLPGPELTYPQAGALIGDALDLEPLDPQARRLLAAWRRDGMPIAVRAMQTAFFRPLPAPGMLFQRFVGEFLDWNDPPLAKSFMRVDADCERIRLRCYRATGWLEDERHPPVDDDVTIAVGGG